MKPSRKSTRSEVLNEDSEPFRVDRSLRPSPLLFMLEARAIYDAAAMVPMLAMKRLLPRGDGHPVLVLPGFLTTSRSTQPLRTFLADLGYKSHRWKLGYNTGYSSRRHDGMRDRVKELTLRYGQKVSLVGWSLGGVFARELAREMPDQVRQVISMGSPFRGHPSASHIQGVFEVFSEVRYRDLPPDLLRHMATPPPVPTTALYTRGDGIVAWQSTVEISTRRDVENIHVGGAHLGLGFNPRSLIAIADRLAQPEGRWQRFEPSRLLRPLYRNWYPDWLVRGKADPLKA